jgi:hypothetical protein
MVGKEQRPLIDCPMAFLRVGRAVAASFSGTPLLLLSLIPEVVIVHQGEFQDEAVEENCRVLDFHEHLGRLHADTSPGGAGE